MNSLSVRACMHTLSTLHADGVQARGYVAAAACCSAAFRCCVGFAVAGYYYRLDKLTGDEWGCMCPDADFTWKSVAVELMLQYVKRTQGSFIENKVRPDPKP